MQRAIFAAIAAAAIASTGCNDLATDVVFDAWPDGGSDDGTLGQGEDCSGGGECAAGLVCASDGTCQPEGSPGTTSEDGDCLTSFDCAFGLVCAADGTCQMPGDPGTGGAGDDCEEDEDCMFGLECLDGVCAGFQIPYWPGGECGAKDELADTFTALFDVRGAIGDFYALPFPNDIRRVGGHLDLEGHPSPGELIPGIGDPVGEFLDVAQNDIDGFGTNVCAFFRFSRWLDGDTLVNGENVMIVDITPGSLDYGTIAASGYRGDSARTPYICWNWLAVCPSFGRPLKPGTTYAAIITNTLMSASTDEHPDPEALARDDDFAAMLTASAPGDDALDDAWAAYAPLRDYLADDTLTDKVSADEIAVAAVFTTQTSIYEIIPKVREAVRAEVAPEIVGPTTDDSGSDYTLHQGKITIPFFQDGVRPFRAPSDGGAIAYDDDGLPIWVEDEDVRFALTVPKTAQPGAGWPVVIYAHGTGGSELSFTQGSGSQPSLASRMAALGVAVIGIEQVQHGDRRGLSDEEAALEASSPDRLFYNFLNPRAARDNNVQAAADHFQVMRLLEDYAAISATAIAFDTSRVIFFGHSQGTQGPMLFAAHEPNVAMVVLSGAGGYLVESLLGKKSPLDVSYLMKIIAADPNLERAHPLLGIVQTAFENVDPLNHAQAIFRADRSDYGWPAEALGYPHRHVFMSYGYGDTYTPETTQHALAKNLWVAQWPLDGDEEHALESIDVIPSLPYSTTKVYDGDEITAVIVQYEPYDDPENAAADDPYDYDGHFVMSRNPWAISQTDAFIESYLADGLPTLYEP